MEEVVADLLDIGGPGQAGSGHEIRKREALTSKHIYYYYYNRHSNDHIFMSV